MTIASSAGSASSETGGGCIRAGPMTSEGEQRSLHTGSVRTRYPSISSSAVEWPNQLTAIWPAGASKALGSGVSNGISAEGLASSRPVMISHNNDRPCSGSILIDGGSRFTKTPSWKFGERSATPRMSDGWAPSAAGAPCSARSTHPPVASETVPAANRSAPRSIRSGSLEFRRPLLHPCDLRFDYVLTAPRLVEEFLLLRRWVFDGA